MFRWLRNLGRIYTLTDATKDEAIIRARMDTEAKEAVEISKLLSFKDKDDAS